MRHLRSTLHGHNSSEAAFGLCIPPVGTLRECRRHIDFCRFSCQVHTATTVTILPPLNTLIISKCCSGGSSGSTKKNSLLVLSSPNALRSVADADVVPVSKVGVGGS